MALDRSRRLCFCLQFGASLTFASFSRRRIVDRVRRATSVWSHQPRVIYASYGGSRDAPRPSGVVVMSPFIGLKVLELGVYRKRKKLRLLYKKRSLGKYQNMCLIMPLVFSVILVSLSLLIEKVTCFSFCAAFIAFLFLNVNVLIAAYAGGGLATAARLWWDPTTYVAGRELDERYFELTKYGLSLATTCLLLLTLLAALAMHARQRCRQFLLLLYIILMAAMVAGEAVLLYFAVDQFKPRLDEGRERLKELVSNVREVLELLAQYHDFMETFRPILEEIEKDVPIQLETMAKIGVGLGVLQVSAVLLALVAVYQARPARRR